jgi:peroxiredoxin (alkyl hydroperoxide reductase subunit C)|tara:strand:- start:140 stop:784 length:645 start_codon:yes stop_codon:yes gene_type:complete
MLVTKPAPDFTAEAVMGDNTIKEISLSDYRGKKVVLFFYPLDFTFVCPTEIIAFDKKLAEFEKRNVQVLGCSVDSKWAHLAWKNTDINKGGIGNIKYPLIADITKSMARDYDVLMGALDATVITDDEQIETSIGGDITLRGSFLIDEDGVVRHELRNDEPLGRNIDDMLRMVDVLAHHQEFGDVCPAGWQKGEDAMQDNPESVANYLSKNADKL